MGKTPRLPESILPDGVPADNRSMTAPGVQASDSSGDFTAPDMATPRFARDDLASKASLRRVERREIEIIEEEDDDVDEDEDHDLESSAPGVSNSTIMLVIGAILVALAAIVLANGAEPTPLCSTQPDWNQYNCRAG